MPGNRDKPGLLMWADFCCPWSYIVAVRLQRVIKELDGAPRLRIKQFPVELFGGEAAPRDVLTLEWWLASVQEPDAPFAIFRGSDWPTTSLPASEAAWCAHQQGYAVGLDYDLRVRRAFFAEGRNIGRRGELLDIARETGLDVRGLRARWDSGQARAAVLAEAENGRARFGTYQTPMLMSPDGTQITPPLAIPRIVNRHIVAMPPLPCVGSACDRETRHLLECVLADRWLAE